MRKFLNYTPNATEMLAMVFVYIGLITLYGDFIISQPMNILIQGVATFLILVFTVWLGRLFTNFIKSLN